MHPPLHWHIETTKMLCTSTTLDTEKTFAQRWLYGWISWILYLIIIKTIIYISVKLSTLFISIFCIFIKSLLYIWDLFASSFSGGHALSPGHFLTADFFSSLFLGPCFLWLLFTFCWLGNWFYFFIILQVWMFLLQLPINLIYEFIQSLLLICYFLTLALLLSMELRQLATSCPFLRIVSPYLSSQLFGIRAIRKLRSSVTSSRSRSYLWRISSTTSMLAARSRSDPSLNS